MRMNCMKVPSVGVLNWPQLIVVVKLDESILHNSRGTCACHVIAATFWLAQNPVVLDSLNHRLLPFRLNILGYKAQAL